MKIDTVWIVCGPVFPDGQAKKTISNDIGVPDGFYKILVWHSEEKGTGGFLPFYFEQSSKEGVIADYLVSIDKIEEITGLDFFSELEDDVEKEIEADQPKKLIK